MSEDDRGRDGGEYAPGADAAFQDWRPVLEEYGWPVEEALLVIYGPTPACPSGESTGNPLAYNNGSVGLFQIHYASHYDKVGGPLEWLYDPVINVRVAYDIYADQGWTPWDCWP